MPAIRTNTTGGVISGWGTALPDKVVTNNDLAARMDTSDEWIRTRTGIIERRYGGTVVGLSIESASKALAMAELTPDRIDALVLATTTPDTTWGTSATIADELGLSCGAYDVNAACSGFIYGLINAYGLLAMGADRVLVIGTDVLTRIVDHDDRGTAPLFADGSGAVVIESTPGVGGMLAWDMDADGSARGILSCELGGTIHMEGREVFRRAVRFMVDSAQKVIKAARVSPDDIALVVPHQANVRIIEAACDRLGIPMDRAAMVIDRTGNTSSASIPLALADALDNGRVAIGDLVLMVGFGGGMTAASCLLRWGHDGGVAIDG